MYLHHVFIGHLRLKYYRSLPELLSFWGRLRRTSRSDFHALGLGSYNYKTARHAGTAKGKP